MSFDSLPVVGARWTRPDFDEERGSYNGYTVLFVTNLSNPHPNHPPQVVYQGDNDKVWSLPLSEWPGNLIPEKVWSLPLSE